MATEQAADRQGGVFKDCCRATAAAPG